MPVSSLGDRPVCSIAEACTVSTLSRRTIAYAIAAGHIASVKRGSRRLILVPSLLEYLAPAGKEI